MPKYNSKKIPNEWLLLALKQAACIHHQDEIVQEIVGQAVRRLTVASTQQRKRLFAGTQQPKRIYLKDEHLLQYLVFFLSETYEKTQEVYAPSSVNERDMIIRYVAFIVRKIMKRNPLYGVTGICRFICHYELKDVREIHQALVDDPDLYKTDDDFRNNRKKMRDMILERFSKYLRVKESAKGREKHFQLRDDQNDQSLLRLVSRSLDSFKPWHTECLPNSFRCHEENQGNFKDSDGHKREIERLHALIHPNCLSTLITALGFDVPDTRLGIPQFFSVESGDDASFNDGSGNSSDPSGRGGNYNDASVDQQRLAALRKLLIEQDEKLERFTPEGVIAVKIDDRVVANFNLGVTNRVQFTVNNEEAELIEIVAQSEQMVLAAHLLDDEIWQSENRKYHYAVRHKSGAKIVFTIRRLTNIDIRNSQLLVTVAYKETRLMRVLAFLRQRIESRFLSWKKLIENVFKSSLAIKSLASITIFNNTSLLRLISLLIIMAMIGLFLSSQFLLHQSSVAPEIVITNESNPNTAVSNETKGKIERYKEDNQISYQQGNTRVYSLREPGRPPIVIYEWVKSESLIAETQRTRSRRGESRPYPIAKGDRAQTRGTERAKQSNTYPSFYGKTEIQCLY